MTLRRCLRVGSVPSLIGGAACYALAKCTEPTLVENTPAADAPWLVLAVLIVAASVTATTIVFWPTFAARAPGREIVVRLQRGPLLGAGAALAAALTAQFLLAAPIVALLAIGLDAPADVHTHHALDSPARPLLQAGEPPLRFALPDSLEIHRIELRPIAGPPTGTFEASRVRVLLDGTPLEGEARFEESGQHAEFPLAPRPTATVEVVRAGGNVPLFFPTGSVVAVEAQAHSRLSNALLAAGASLLVTGVALAVSALAGTVGALPTILTVAMVLVFLLTAGGVGPLSGILLQLMRGQWIGVSPVLIQGAPSLAVGCAAMIGTMLLHRRQRP